MDPKIARMITTQMYVSKVLSINPAKGISIIKDNKEYFPNITEDMLNQIIKEHNITENDIKIEQKKLNHDRKYV